MAVTIDGRTGGSGTETLTYNTVAGVSDNITIQPSGPKAGSRRDCSATTAYQRSHSYVIALTEADRARLLREAEAILHAGFPEGQMAVAYQSRLWLARRR